MQNRIANDSMIHLNKYLDNINIIFNIIISLRIDFHYFCLSLSQILINDVESEHPFLSTFAKLLIIVLVQMLRLFYQFE